MGEEKSQNAKYLFEKIGFEDFAQNEFWNEKPSTKSVGAVAAILWRKAKKKVATTLKLEEKSKKEEGAIKKEEAERNIQKAMLPLLEPG